MFDVVAIGSKQATISEEDASEMEGTSDPREEPRLQRPTSTRDPVFRSSADGNNTREVAMQRMSSQAIESANGAAPRKGMVLPFQPLAMSFDSVNYFVDMPPVRIPSSLVRF